MGQSKSNTAAPPGPTHRQAPQRTGGRLGVALAAAVLVGGAVVAGIALSDRDGAPGTKSDGPSQTSAAAQPANNGSTILGASPPAAPPAAEAAAPPRPP